MAAGLMKQFCLLLIILSIQREMVFGRTAANPQRWVYCSNKNYPSCYMHWFKCPTACLLTCEIDCAACKSICSCDKQGSVCNDPRFIGGDGVTFYFHGKKDSDFCLVSDTNLHINAHFIGKRGQGMKRDFTWVQSIALFFGSHQLYVGADKVLEWDDLVDHLRVMFDGVSIQLPMGEGVTWAGPEFTSIMRTSHANSITFDVAGQFKVSVRVVPVTDEESRVHNYGVADDDCFAHLELGFKFYSLSPEVDGVLGQTYRNDYRTSVKMGAAMPIMGGNLKYSTTNLFVADCAVARFNRSTNQPLVLGRLTSAMNCTSGFGGSGLVCKK